MMKFGPFTGRYVFHCHILEHEDYDMMRPFEVVERKCSCLSECNCCCKCKDVDHCNERKRRKKTTFQRRKLFSSFFRVMFNGNGKEGVWLLCDDPLEEMTEKATSQTIRKH